MERFFLLIFAFFKEISHEIGREEWFDSVKKGLQFSTEVKAYLRDFDHPDDLAQTNSRSDIVKIMEFIATIIVNHSDKVRIVGYRDTSSGKKNPLDWISGEMKKINPNITPDNYIDRSVKILKKQPSANSSTFYLFEGRSLLYNQYDGSGKWRYYKVDLTTSVIPFFINEGLQTFFVTA